MNLLLLSAFSVLPGCWDGAGLTPSEIENKYGIHFLAYDDDFDETVGQVPLNDSGPQEGSDGPGAGCWGPAGVQNA